jgi:hypothetical protein
MKMVSEDHGRETWDGIDGDEVELLMGVSPEYLSDASRDAEKIMIERIRRPIFTSVS